MKNDWVVCQIGAREHYAIPRALAQSDRLDLLVTDLWCRPGSLFSQLPFTQRLKDRYHPNLAKASVQNFNERFATFEIASRFQKQSGWKRIMARNDLFQRLAAKNLNDRITQAKRPLPKAVFSYSYAARDIFKVAGSVGIERILGQIDPGPEEERIVAEEHQRYPEIASSWKPVPRKYWESWRKETRDADSIVVNSNWSKRCLIQSGISPKKIAVIPLVYESADPRREETNRNHDVFHLLFLGTINLRKGIARLIEAMKLLESEPIQLTLAGPTEIDPTLWQNLRNVDWIGPQPRSKVGEIYRTADAFILPTLSDGFALTQLEALSHGLPVISSKFCGEVVKHGENGWILPDLAPQTIAEVIAKASQHHLEMRHPVISRNSLEFLAEDLLSLSSSKRKKGGA